MAAAAPGLAAPRNKKKKKNKNRNRNRRRKRQRRLGDAALRGIPWGLG